MRDAYFDTIIHNLVYHIDDCEDSLHKHKHRRRTFYTNSTNGEFRLLMTTNILTRPQQYTLASIPVAIEDSLNSNWKMRCETVALMISCGQVQFWEDCRQVIYMPQ